MKTSKNRMFPAAILFLAIAPIAIGCMESTGEPEENTTEQASVGVADEALQSCAQSISCSKLASNPTCMSCDSRWECPLYVAKPYPPCNTMIDLTPECADTQPGPTTVTTWQEVWWCSSCSGSFFDYRTSTTTSCGC